MPWSSTQGVDPPRCQHEAQLCKHKHLDFQKYVQTTSATFPLNRISVNEVHAIQILTLGQSDNDLWKLARKGRITASLFHEVAVKSTSGNEDIGSAAT